MYHSLEVRVPLLGKRVVNLAASYRAKDSIDLEKDILKTPLRNLLLSKLGPNSNQVVSKMKKGFEPPLKHWLRNELRAKVEARIFSTPKVLSRYINASGVRKLWEDHQNHKSNNADTIWSIYSLFVWIDRHLSNENKHRR